MLDWFKGRVGLSLRTHSLIHLSPEKSLKYPGVIIKSEVDGNAITEHPGHSGE